MEAIPADLSLAAHAARRQLSALARAAAGANAGAATPGATLALAGAAREAIFSDALLGAMHARLEELRNAAK